MFYVHLFLKAMYRKKTFFCCISKHLHTSGNTEAGSCLHHEGDVEKQRRSKPNAAAGAQARGQRKVNIARTTAASRRRPRASSRRASARSHPADLTGFTGNGKVRKMRSFKYFAVKSADCEAADLSHACPISAVVCFFCPNEQIFVLGVNHAERAK